MCSGFTADGIELAWKGGREGRLRGRMEGKSLPGKGGEVKREDGGKELLHIHTLSKLTFQNGHCRERASVLHVHHFVPVVVDRVIKLHSCQV